MNCGGRFPELFFRCSTSKRCIDGVGKSSFGYKKIDEFVNKKAKKKLQLIYTLKCKKNGSHTYMFFRCSTMLEVVSLMLRPLHPIHDLALVFMLPNIQNQTMHTKWGRSHESKNIKKKRGMDEMWIMRMWCSKQSSNLMIQRNASAEETMHSSEGELCFSRLC
jgi:hypothetical protein